MYVSLYLYDTQQAMKKKKIIIGVSAGCIIVFLITIFGNISFAAKAADSLLRPVIGEKNTLLLESWYFKVQDKADALHYTVVGAKTPAFSSPIEANQQPTSNSDQMDLDHIASILSKPLPGEGVWIPIPQPLYPKQIIVARTFIRPDMQRPYATVSLVKMDMKKLGIGTEAGTYYPGGTHKVYGPGFVPKTIQDTNRLMAVFNGGFQERDGHYGMIVGHTIYVPLRQNLATLVMDTNGSVQLVDYTGQPFSPDVLSVRQNGPFLVRDGKIAPFVEQGLDTWGRTTTNSMYTWRSGLGITKEGNLIYAVGNALVPETLAKALLAAGAVNALQLDINPFWVRFILYQTKGNGQYTYYPLLSSMKNGGYQYLHRYNKDFFYVYKK